MKCINCKRDSIPNRTLCISCKESNARSQKKWRTSEHGRFIFNTIARRNYWRKENKLNSMDEVQAQDYIENLVRRELAK